MEAQGHPPTLWRSRLDSGFLTFCSDYRMNVHIFPCLPGTFDEGAMGMDEKY